MGFIIFALFIHYFCTLYSSIKKVNSTIAAISGKE